MQVGVLFWRRLLVRNFYAVICCYSWQLSAKEELSIGKYLPRRTWGKYSPIFNTPGAKNCFCKIFRDYRFQRLHKLSWTWKAINTQKHSTNSCTTVGWVKIYNGLVWRQIKNESSAENKVVRYLFVLIANNLPSCRNLLVEWLKLNPLLELTISHCWEFLKHLSATVYCLPNHFLVAFFLIPSALNISWNWRHVSFWKPACRVTCRQNRWGLD